MKHLSKEEISGLRDALENERADLEAQLAEHGKKVNGTWQGTPEGFGENEADETDEADKMEELATNIPLVEQLEAHLRDVVDALAKMEAGTYGVCEKTGEPIPLARLRANPAARTHVEHA
jgi:RNA polymerase-binding transcription factor DksA